MSSRSSDDPGHLEMMEKYRQQTGGRGWTQNKEIPLVKYTLFFAFTSDWQVLVIDVLLKNPRWILSPPSLVLGGWAFPRWPELSPLTSMASESSPTKGPGVLFNSNIPWLWEVVGECKCVPEWSLLKGLTSWATITWDVFHVGWSSKITSPSTSYGTPGKVEITIRGSQLDHN